MSRPTAGKKNGTNAVGQAKKTMSQPLPSPIPISAKRLCTSCLGLGWLPVAPATWASLLPMTIVGLMCQASVAPWIVASVIALMIVAGSLVCIAWSPSLIAATGQKDPREVVADELAGQAVCYLAVLLPPVNTIPAQRMWLVAVAGFLLFRGFDIIKPWSARQLEDLPQGWGILADDLMAGVYAGVFLGVGIWLVA